MKRGLEDTDIPLLVLGDALFKDHSFKDLLVYGEGGVDWHPNEIAHGIAAKEIVDFLCRKKLLTPP